MNTFECNLYVIKGTEKKERKKERKRGITVCDRKRAMWIRKQTKIKDILMTLKEKKWT